MENTNISSTTVDTAVDKVSNLIEQLASQLGIAVEHFYPIFIQQQVMSGIHAAVMATLMLIGGILAIYTGISTSKEKDSEGLPTFLFFVAFFCCIGFFYTSSDAITLFWNPEYHALMEIKDFAKSLK